MPGRYMPLGFPRSSASFDEKEDQALMRSSSSNEYSILRQKLLVPTLAVSSLLNAVFLILSLGVFFHYGDSAVNAELRHASTWSPLFDLINLDVHTRKLNGSVYPTSLNPGITQQFPNPAADAVWEEWEITRVFPITKDALVKMRKNPKTAVKLDAAIFGLGEDMYAAHLDIFHQLHCLNTLRQVAYGRYYNQSLLNPDITGSTIVEVHVNHCVTMLAQAIQCSGNLNMDTVHWTRNFRTPMPDFSIDRKCIDFEKLTTWRRANTADVETYDRFVAEKPKDQIQEPDPLPSWWPGL